MFVSILCLICVYVRQHVYGKVRKSEWVEIVTDGSGRVKSLKIVSGSGPVGQDPWVKNFDPLGSALLFKFKAHTRNKFVAFKDLKITLS